MEVINALFSAIGKLFSATNWAMLMERIREKGPAFINRLLHRPDVAGYYTGYAIGFIISEIIFVIATQGVGLAEAFDRVSQAVYKLKTFPVYLDRALEQVENILEVMARLLDKKNLEALLQFMLQLPVTVAKAVAHMYADRRGYIKGFIIGFIVQEVLFLISTGGAAILSDAFVKVGESVVALARGIGKIASRVSALSERAATEAFAVVVELIQFLRAALKSGKFPELLKQLLKWLEELLTGIANVEDQAGGWITGKYKAL